MRDLMYAIAAEVKEQAPSIYSRDLVELIFVQPYCRIQNVVDAGLAKRQTAAVYLRRLTEIGVLREVKAGREKLFVNPRLIDLLLDADGLEPHNEREQA
jgi:Fic family protein